jgi:GR25 family glycosyltransferase involved in LPS biosynthesis
MKIECAYILYIDDPNSIKYMKECSQSCEKYNIPWLAIQWYKPPITTSELFANHDFNLNPRLDHPSNLIHLKEAMCSTGHISIWRRIYERHTGAVAIFEHDAVVKRDFKSIDVEDGEIAFLGYRIDQSEDYECVSDEFAKLPVNEFSGTHAYAITPNTAKHLLGRVARKDQFTRLCENCQCDKEYLPVCSVDWWLGHNMLGLNKMTIVDPCPVVAVVGGRKSFTQYYERVAKFNAPANSGLPKKFMSGIINKNKYFVDEKQFLKFM